MSERRADSESDAKADKPKRVRLSCACTRCRVKKLKCDEKLPKCTHCQIAEVDCVVVKPSDKSHVDPVRRKTGLATPARKLKQLDRAAAKASAVAELALARGAAQQTMSIPAATSASPASAASPLEASAATSASRSYTEAAENDGTHPRINDVGLMQGGQDAAERKFSGASSSFIFLKWLDAESTDKSRSLLPHLRHSIRTSEAYAFDGVMPSPPTLPKPRWIEFFLQRYFSTIHALFPIVDEDQVRHLAQDPELHGKDPLASILLELVLSHGAEAGEAAPEFSAEAERMFQHAWMAMPAVIASPFETSVQILGLLCLGLHSRNRDGAASNLAGFAVRIAQSLGLHHKRPNESGRFDARIWWCIYCIEKQLCFETGRPSSIHDSDCTITPDDCGEDVVLVGPGYSQKFNLFKALISICIELSKISSSLFRRGAAKLSTIEALRLVGEADARLVNCTEQWPIDLRPNMDGYSPTSWLLPFVTRIHCLYFLAMMTLHRLSLFDEGTVVMPHLSHPELEPYARRLRTSGTTCAQAARATLTLLERLAEFHPSDTTAPVHPMLTAIYVIAIRAYRLPTTWQASADLLFLKKACEFATARCRELGFDEAFLDLFARLYEKVELRITEPQPSSWPETHANSPAAATQGPNRAPAIPDPSNVATTGGSSIVTDWLSANAAIQRDGTDSVETWSAGAGAGADETSNILDYWAFLVGDGSESFAPALAPFWLA